MVTISKQSLSFESTITLIFTPVANLFSFRWIVSTIVQFTRNFKGLYGIVSCNRSYSYIVRVNTKFNGRQHSTQVEKSTDIFRDHWSYINLPRLTIARDYWSTSNIDKKRIKYSDLETCAELWNPCMTALPLDHMTTLWLQKFYVEQYQIILPKNTHWVGSTVT